MRTSYNPLSPQARGMSGRSMRYEAPLSSFTSRGGMEPAEEPAQPVSAPPAVAPTPETVSQYQSMVDSSGVPSAPSDVPLAGPMTREAALASAQGLVGKGLLSGVTASLVGAPTNVAAKYGLTSMATPLGALTAMADIAIGGLDDVAVDKQMASRVGEVEPGTGLKSKGVEGLSPEQLEEAKRLEALLYSEQSFADKTGDRFGALRDIGTRMKEDIGYDLLATDMNPFGAYSRGMAKDPQFSSLAERKSTFGNPFSRGGWGPEGNATGGGAVGGISGLGEAASQSATNEALGLGPGGIASPGGKYGSALGGGMFGGSAYGGGGDNDGRGGRGGGGHSSAGTGMGGRGAGTNDGYGR